MCSDSLCKSLEETVYFCVENILPPNLNWVDILQLVIIHSYCVAYIIYLCILNAVIFAWFIDSTPPPPRKNKLSGIKEKCYPFCHSLFRNEGFLAKRPMCVTKA
jgi:hypothetical protein